MKIGWVLLAVCVLLLAIFWLLAMVATSQIGDVSYDHRKAVETSLLVTQSVAPISMNRPITSLPVAVQPISVTVTAEMLNLRYGPSLKYGIIAALPKGTQMEFSNLCEKGWAKLRDGWVYAKYVEPKVCP